MKLIKSRFLMILLKYLDLAILKAYAKSQADQLFSQQIPSYCLRWLELRFYI